MTFLALVLGCRSPIVGEGYASFSEGRLEEAVETWGAGAAQGDVSGVLAYDLGTAWYRKGDLPLAIGWLRTAARLRPRDGHVHHNLSLARADLGAGIPEPVSSAAAWMAIVTPGELGVLGAFAALVGSALVVAARLATGWLRAGRAIGATALALGLVAGSAGVWGARESARHPVAVVVQGDVPVRDGPAIDAGERFTLPAGSEVRVERSHGAFLLLEDGRERRGWVPANAVFVGWGPLRSGSSPIAAQGTAPPG